MTKLSDIIASFVKGGATKEPTQESPSPKEEIDKYLNPNKKLSIEGEDETNDEAASTIIDPNDGIEITDEFKEAFKLIESRAPFIFITGRAGTGKSTFINLLKEKLKSFALVAPTGVAALNVGGQTIHSFFRLAPGPIDFSKIKKLANRTPYRALRTLIIDEISMVRADLLDAMDHMLRANGEERFMPFGGVQVIAIGDLFQLPPVVSTEEEQAFLMTGYKSSFFFSSKVLENIKIKNIEFTKIFRQKEESFISLLNDVREGKNLPESLKLLNTRISQPNRNTFEGVILTATNDTAARINTYRLIDIKSADRTYLGTITGDIKIEKTKLPAPMELVLKVGARVMFVKNDRSKRWVNGSLGIVTELGDTYVTVLLKDGLTEAEVRVEPDKWENFKYEYDPEENAVKAKEIGVYRQIPLTLAWAITIHKSQGKTFDQIHIDLDRGAFAEGQVYVALSRCRTLEGVSLQSPVKQTDIYVNYAVVQFNSEMTT